MLSTLKSGWVKASRGKTCSTVRISGLILAEWVVVVGGGARTDSRLRNALNFKHDHIPHHLGNVLFLFSNVPRASNARLSLNVALTEFILSYKEKKASKWIVTNTFSINNPLHVFPSDVPSPFSFFIYCPVSSKLPLTLLIKRAPLTFFQSCKFTHQQGGYFDLS